MTGHRMIRVAKKHFTIFGGNAGRAQTARERMTKVVDANQWQAHFPPCLLPTIVVHGSNASASIGKDPDRMLPSLRFDDRPGDVIQDHDVWSLGLERLRRNHEHAATDLGHGNLALPLQTAHVAVAQARVHRKGRHAREVRR